MKKVLFTLALMLAFAVISEAQTVIYGRANQQYFKHTAPITLTNTTAVTVEIHTLAQWPTTQHAIVKVDSVSGDHTAVDLTLHGRNFTTGAWVSISSTIVNMELDTKIPITLTNTTETRWRQFRLTFTPTGTGVSTIANIEFLMLKPD